MVRELILLLGDVIVLLGRWTWKNRLPAAVFCLIGIMIGRGCGRSEPKKVTHPPHPAHVTQRHQPESPAVAPTPRRATRNGKSVESPETARTKATPPEMPLRPISRGPLSGLAVVVDPGHGGNDPGCPWVEDHGFAKVHYWEAAYTYKAAWELSTILRKQGASVYLTCWSSVYQLPEPQAAWEPLPVPKDAVFLLNGKIATAGVAGLSARSSYARRVYNTVWDKAKLVFVSLHIDSANAGWQGGHVCVDVHTPGAPSVAMAISELMEQAHYDRKKNGQQVRVLDRRGLYIIRNSHNPIHQRMLVEMVKPSGKSDGYRVRAEANRAKLLSTLVKGIEQGLR